LLFCFSAFLLLCFPGFPCFFLLVKPKQSLRYTISHINKP
jgi:hypothetical protein